MRGAVILTFAAAALAAQEPVRTPPVFGVSVDTVYIDAFVTRSGRPVPGLEAADFELKDNGVSQAIEIAGAEAQPLLAVLAFDVSGSLDGEKLSALKAASASLLGSLRPEDRAGLITFSDEIGWRVEPSADKSLVRKALDDIRPGGGTPVRDALFAALTLPETEGRSLVVLFTDGVDNMSWLGWKEVREVAQRSNALVYIVTLEPPAVRAEETNAFLGFRGPQPSAKVLEFEDSYGLRQIAEVTGGRYLVAASRESLASVFAAIAESMSRRYILRYAPQGVPRPGWHRIELKVRGVRADVHTRSGYWVPENEPVR